MLHSSQNVIPKTSAPIPGCRFLLAALLAESWLRKAKTPWYISSTDRSILTPICSRIWARLMRLSSFSVGTSGYKADKLLVKCGPPVGVIALHE